MAVQDIQTCILPIPTTLDDSAPATWPFPSAATKSLDAAVPPLPESRPLPLGAIVTDVAQSWISNLVQSLDQAKFTEAKEAFLEENGFWRDIMALTWDFKTFVGNSAIESMLKERYIATGGMNNIKMSKDLKTTYETVSVDESKSLSFIQAGFTFHNSIGKGGGIFRIVNTDAGWKGWTLFTTLEELHGYPERIGPNRKHGDAHGEYLPRRAAETSFENSDPRVIIIGAGHTGLEIAARLKVLGVEALVLERNERIGDNWRNRYSSLTLHGVVHYDHLPFMPFPKSWPTYSPAPKLANFLEYYAEAMELNVWTSSNVIGLTKLGDERWEVEMESPSRFSGIRKMHVRHVVAALGFGGSQPKIPVPKPGQLDFFKGKVLHTTQFKNASEFQGKHVVVVGSGTSGHDCCQELYHGGAKVTMLQRSGTYVLDKDRNAKLLLRFYQEDGPAPEIADRLAFSFPLPVTKLIGERTVRVMAENDKELLQNLRNVGFQLEMHYSMLWYLYHRGGGYYLEAGCSQLIIDRQISLHSGVEIERFVADGIVLNDKEQTEIKCDAVICYRATGYGDGRAGVIPLLKQKEVRSSLLPVWGVDDHWELMSVWREWCHEGFYYAYGNLAFSRFYSKFLAMRILKKEIDEGKA
ncbi:FAD/NAD(P)-binding domain-containing protein [Atractiella rhizophila]|nr:FAD/NAD(P)-binding domain-containing protein [Atractiella rhizophila]